MVAQSVETAIISHVEMGKKKFFCRRLFWGDDGHDDDYVDSV